MDAVSSAETSAHWRFAPTFWLANGVELLERAAYYGMFIALVLFLTDVVGFTDVEAGWIGALFSALIYFLPFLTGAAADRIGFRPALSLAFGALAVGYAALGLYPHKLSVLLSLALIAFGGSFVKPVIAGTVARCTSESIRARAYSIFYMMVNVGSFTGKTIAKPVRTSFGLDAVPLSSALAACAALVLVALFYRPEERAAPAASRTARDSLRGLLAVLRHKRFLALILITAGFWIIQGQLYASMPKYVLRMVGEKASPEWYANVNPLIVVLLVVPITHLVRRLQPVTSIAISLALIPLSALTMALSSGATSTMRIFGVGLHPVTVVMVIGIAIQGLAECFLSPRYLEYASRQAPAGQEGLYMGYAYLNVFFAWLVGFAGSGYLLEIFCPDPRTLSAADAAQRVLALAGNGSMPDAYVHAHYIWYVFSATGAAAFLLLIVFQYRVSRADAVRARSQS